MRAARRCRPRAPWSDLRWAPWHGGRPAIPTGSPGGAVLLAAWSYTMLRIMPVNNALRSTSLDQAGPASRTLLERWGRLHLGRTAMGVVSTAIFLWAALR